MTLDTQQLARRGAEQRLREIEAAIDELQLFIGPTPANGDGPTWDNLNGQAPASPPRATTKAPAEKLAGRKRTAAALARVARRKRPSPASVLRDTSIGPLLKHGYLRHDGIGYIRTEKPFVV